MNSVVLIGRLAKDVELAKTKSGTSVARTCLAVPRDFKQEGQPEADFINLMAWSKTAELLANYVNKGDQVAIAGRIQVRSYEDKEGKKQYFTEVIVNNIQFLESKKSDLKMEKDDLPW